MRIFKRIPSFIILSVFIQFFFLLTVFAQDPTDINGLVGIKDLDPSIVIDLRYATPNNFTGKKIYPDAICVLRKETAQKLMAANARFKKDGYCIKIWDAYRPLSVQKIFWSLVPDDRYVANPYTGGSKHNRGGAVDITLVDAFGKELEMPSLFDDFTEKASPSNPHMSATARQHVEYLTLVMKENGFLPIKDEWWHFDDKDWNHFPLMDIPLEKFIDDHMRIEKNMAVEISSRFPIDFETLLSSLDKGVKQFILVNSSNSYKATLTGWQKMQNAWNRILGPVDCVIGKNGLARDPDMKKEGDGKTPAGIYKLGIAFGYLPNIETRLNYHQTDQNDFWVDDPASAQYNQWVKGKPNANSFERLKRDDNLYKYGIVIEYNTQPVIPGEGSAIFIHVWRSPDSPTAGCIAVSEENILQLLRWLDKLQNPVIILGSQ